MGNLDLISVTAIALLILGPPGAAAAALLYALGPWPLEQSRIAQEMTIASTMVSLALLGFLLWLKYRKGRWLIASAVFFGLSLYAFSITKAFTPLMIIALAIRYRRELRAARRPVLLAALIVTIFAMPQIVSLMSSDSDVSGRFAQLSLWSYQCATCGPALSIWQKLENLGASFGSYFTPSFLFIDGDRGDHWTLVHPPGFGQLFPEQALLIAAASIALFRRNPVQFTTSKRVKRVPRLEPCAREHQPPDRKGFALLLIGWLIFAALPASAIVPLGAYAPEADTAAPTAYLLMDHSLRNAPLTPQLLLSHPDSRHAVLQMAPWTLLSALGFVMLLELPWASFPIRAMLAGLLLLGITLHAGLFVRSYFTDYPVIAAPYFQYGMEDAVRAAESSSAPERPVVISYLVNQPYIYVLFYQGYPPARFQRLPRSQMPGIAGPVLQFDRYLFVSPEAAYQRLEHGIFVFAAGEKVPAAASTQIRYPDGRLAYSVITK